MAGNKKPALGGPLNGWQFAIGGALMPFFWLIVLSVALWIVRRWFPRAEAILFASPTVGLRRLWRAIREARHRRA